MNKKLSDAASPFAKLLDALATICLVLSGVCMVILVFSFGWLVFGRYVLNDTPTWVEQVALLLVVTITFLGAAVGVHQRTHLNVDILSALLPAKGQAILNLLIDLLLAGFGAVMAYQSYGLVQFAWHKSIPLIGVPDGLRYIPMMISGALITLFCLARVPAVVGLLCPKPSAVVVTKEAS